MPQARNIVSYEQEYPGAYRWPIYEVLCPECGHYVTNYGDVSTEIDGEEHYLCVPCGNKAFPGEAVTSTESGEAHGG